VGLRVFVRKPNRWDMDDPTGDGIMKKALLILASILIMASAANAQIIITGAFDGPLSGGLPKGIELYVCSDVADLSLYGVGSANNGGGTDGEEFTFPADAVAAGTFLYVASEDVGFPLYFGFAPDYNAGFAMSINGDDAVELFCNGEVVDTFGDINMDGTGTAWDHLDGWAKRNTATGPDGAAFVISSWTFSGINALDGETTNATAATPFPLGGFACDPAVDNEPGSWGSVKSLYR